MGFLETIQAELVDRDSSIASTLLKLRLLAAKLGSDELAQWIRYEAEGYAQDADIPPYRVLGISFSGTFHGPFGTGVQNAPIPSLLIKKYAGDDWTVYKIRESAAAVEKMASGTEGVDLDLSNLMIPLKGKVYPEYVPAQIVGHVSHTALVETFNAIRNRILEITIEIASKVPGAEGVDLTSITREPEATTQVFHQIIHGNMTNIQSSGADASIQVTVAQRDIKSLTDCLQNLGLSVKETEELARLISHQEPTKKEEAGLNPGVRKWLSDRIMNGFDSGITGGVAAATKIVQEAAMQYWGLK